MNAGRALGVGIVLAPFISAILLGLGRAGRALRDRITRRNSRWHPPTN